MKICYTCKKTKEIISFNKNKSKKDKLNTICRDCSKIRSKTYYKDNREKHLKQVILRRSKGNVKYKTYLKQIKSNGCCLCKEKEYYCIDFHHLFDKSFNIGGAGMRERSYQEIADEISKCILICANCHRKLHANLIQLPVDIKPISVKVFSAKNAL